MCKTSCDRRFRPDEGYMKLLKRSINHAEILNYKLKKLKEEYPVGVLNSRDIYRAQTCIMCALDNLL